MYVCAESLLWCDKLKVNVFVIDVCYKGWVFIFVKIFVNCGQYFGY